jgi:pyruvate formate lyase activating enzyme
MHTVLDTSGYAPWEDYEKVLPFVDLVLYDIKHADSSAHRKYTGVPNELIRENLARIDARGVAVEIRIPVIPGINDARENIDATCRFLAGLAHVQRVTLLPYHPFGRSKYARIGRTCRLDGLAPPSQERMEEIAGWVAGQGLVAHALEVRAPVAAWRI